MLRFMEKLIQTKRNQVRFRIAMQVWTKRNHQDRPRYHEIAKSAILFQIPADAYRDETVETIRSKLIHALEEL